MNFEEKLIERINNEIKYCEEIYNTVDLEATKWVYAAKISTLQDVLYWIKNIEQIDIKRYFNLLNI